MKYWMMSVAAAAAIASVPASAATVTFGEVALNNGDSVTNQYQSYGFTGSNLYYYTDSRDTFDGKGVAGRANPSDFNFATPISALSVDYLALSFSGGATLSVYAGTTLLDSFSYVAGNADVNATRAFSGSGITKFSFTSSNPRYFAISTLRFTPSAAVPEPATWAMMLIGFGAAGYALRRRRSAVVTTEVRFA